MRTLLPASSHALRLAWHWQRPRFIAIGATAVVVSLLWLWLIPQERAALAAAQAETARLEAELHSPPVERSQQELETEALNNILAQFPPPTAVSAVLAELSSARTKHGLQIGEVVSQPIATDPRLQWAQHEFAVPVSGSFADTRRLLSALLASHPTLALDSIEVRRANPGSPGVETQLRFSLFLRR